MDQNPLVENQIDDGQKLINAIARAGIRLDAVFWMRRLDEERWTLHFVTPLVEEKGLAGAYREIYALLRASQVGTILDSDVKLLGVKEKIAQKVLAIQKKSSGRMATQLQDELFGAEEIYLYSLGNAKYTVYGLYFEGEPSGALHLSLEPHNPGSALVVEDSSGRTEYGGKTGMDWEVLAPEGSRLERNEIGLMSLKWNLNGKEQESDANEVLALADLGYHGFRVVKKPGKRRQPKEFSKP